MIRDKILEIQWKAHQSFNETLKDMGKPFTEMTKEQFFEKERARLERIVEAEENATYIDLSTGREVPKPF